ncbi:DUF4419 domain-containing protein [Polyangium sorediatum]|uniref:DUF4419 domain-containing protein n=1 Tax=Polyangium sorediatum TaxID=889274 RepID=A0ABT6NTI2_9BACT|nr:DUF4419 domain-containing protein [Polyangium sorediatum]MDI1431450.1 DUF4419 domain-containing protein [Polyangium sorediatum]
MSVTFLVDDVPRATTPLPTRRLAETHGDALTFGGDADLPVVDHGSTHALLGAVHLAFAEHRPLVLSPDAVWLTIAQGVAQHVRLHAEQLRSRLVRHTGTARIEVPVEGPMPTDAVSWASIVGSFRDHVADQVGAGRARLFECDFSTSTEVDRIASQVVLLDAYAPYFDYYLACICGIPEITLLGTPADWKRLRERIDVIAELDLDFWTHSLAPICDELVRAASGQPDLDVWRRIYKPVDAYGGDVITGWIARLYPYLMEEGRVTQRNPLLGLPLDEPRGGDEEDWYRGPGIRTGDVLGSPSTVRIHVVDMVTSERHIVALDGGVTAVSQDAEGRLTPISGWALRRSSPAIGEVLERIRAGHRFVPAPKRDDRFWYSFNGPADFVAIYHAFEEATLFAETSPWRFLRPVEQHNVVVSLPYDHTTAVLRFLDLPDGTFLAMTSGRNSVLVRGRIDAVEPPPPAKAKGDTYDPESIETLPRQRRSSQPFEEVTILRRPLAEVLLRALDSGGATDLPEDGRLRDVLAEWYFEPPPPPRERKKPGRR